jgi:hypothetical protein
MHPQGRRNIDGRENVKTLSSVILLAGKIFHSRNTWKNKLHTQRWSCDILHGKNNLLVPGDRLQIMMSGAVLYWSALPQKLLHLGVSLTRVILQEK